MRRSIVRWVIGLGAVSFIAWVIVPYVLPALVGAAVIVGLLVSLGVLVWLGYGEGRGPAGSAGAPGSVPPGVGDRRPKLLKFAWVVWSILVAWCMWSWVVSPAISRVADSRPKTTTAIARQGVHGDYKLSEKIDPLALQGIIATIEYCRGKEHDQEQLLEAELKELSAMRKSGKFGDSERRREAVALKSLRNIAEERRVCQKEVDEVEKKDDRKDAQTSGPAEGGGPRAWTAIQSSLSFRGALWFATIAFAVGVVLFTLGLHKFGRVVALVAVLVAVLAVAHSFIWDTDVALAHAKKVLPLGVSAASAGLPTQRPGEERYIVELSSDKLTPPIKIPGFTDWNIHPELGSWVECAFADDPKRELYHFPQSGLPFNGPLHCHGQGVAEIVLWNIGKSR